MIKQLLVVLLLSFSCFAQEDESVLVNEYFDDSAPAPPRTKEEVSAALEALMKVNETALLDLENNFRSSYKFSSMCGYTRFNQVAYLINQRMDCIRNSTKTRVLFMERYLNETQPSSRIRAQLATVNSRPCCKPYYRQVFSMALIKSLLFEQEKISSSINSWCQEDQACRNAMEEALVDRKKERNKLLSTAGILQLPTCMNKSGRFKALPAAKKKFFLRCQERMIKLFQAAVGEKNFNKATAKIVYAILNFSVLPPEKNFSWPTELVRLQKEYNDCGYSGTCKWRWQTRATTVVLKLSETTGAGKFLSLCRQQSKRVSSCKFGCRFDRAIHSLFAMMANRGYSDLYESSSILRLTLCNTTSCAGLMKVVEKQQAAILRVTAQESSRLTEALADPGPAIMCLTTSSLVMLSCIGLSVVGIFFLKQFFGRLVWILTICAIFLAHVGREYTCAVTVAASNPFGDKYVYVISESVSLAIRLVFTLLMLLLLYLYLGSLASKKVPKIVFPTLAAVLGAGVIVAIVLVFVLPENIPSLLSRLHSFRYPVNNTLWIPSVVLASIAFMASAFCLALMIHTLRTSERTTDTDDLRWRNLFRSILLCAGACVAFLVQLVYVILYYPGFSFVIESSFLGQTIPEAVVSFLFLGMVLNAWTTSAIMSRKSALDVSLLSRRSSSRTSVLSTEEDSEIPQQYDF